MLKNYILCEGAGGPTIYSAKQEHISRVEKRSEIAIWKTGENRLEQN